MIIDDIIDYKKIQIIEAKKEMPLRELEKGIKKASGSFYECLSKEGPVRLIAELKKASPSRGIIREQFDPTELALECVENGADCLSILTDEKFFKGSLDYLIEARRIVKVPLLRKEFIIDEYQVVESRFYGADAILLLANVLDEKKLKRFLSLAGEYGMDALVEVHDRKELDTALDIEPKIIGINNRDLKTFKVDINTTLNLAQFIPDDKIIVSESGIFKQSDINLVSSEGIDAVLVGESIMSSKIVGEKIRELRG